MSAETLTLDERYLVSLAAAVSAGCVPCAAYYQARARGACLSADDIRCAVETAASVRRAATEATLQCVLAAPPSAGDDPRAKSSGQPASRLTILQSVSAAYAVNNETLFDEFLQEARAQRIGDGTLLACVQIARDVRAMAIEILDARVEAYGGSPESSVPGTCRCG